MDFATISTIRSRPAHVLESGRGSRGIDDHGLSGPIDRRCCLCCYKALLGPVDRVHSFCDATCFEQYWQTRPETMGFLELLLMLPPRLTIT